MNSILLWRNMPLTRMIYSLHQKAVISGTITDLFIDRKLRGCILDVGDNFWPLRSGTEIDVTQEFLPLVRNNEKISKTAKNKKSWMWRFWFFIFGFSDAEISHFNWIFYQLRLSNNKYTTQWPEIGVYWNIDDFWNWSN